jgi:hypothetical protein
MYVHIHNTDVKCTFDYRLRLFEVRERLSQKGRLRLRPGNEFFSKEGRSWDEERNLPVGPMDQK